MATCTRFQMVLHQAVTSTPTVTTSDLTAATTDLETQSSSAQTATTTLYPRVLHQEDTWIQMVTTSDHSEETTAQLTQHLSDQALTQEIEDPDQEEDPVSNQSIYLENVPSTASSTEDPREEEMTETALTLIATLTHPQEEEVEVDPLLVDQEPATDFLISWTREDVQTIEDLETTPAFLKASLAIVCQIAHTAHPTEATQAVDLLTEATPTTEEAQLEDLPTEEEEQEDLMQEPLLHAHQQPSQPPWL